jgi:hypothetical protein
MVNKASNQKVKSPQELRLVKRLMNAAFEFLQKSEKFYIPDVDGLINTDAPASRQNVLQAVSAGTFRAFYHRFATWEAGFTDAQKDRWYDENPHHVEDDHGNVYRHYGGGGAQVPDAPKNWLRAQEEGVTEALIAGGYLTAADNVVPLEAAPIKEPRSVPAPQGVFAAFHQPLMELDYSPIPVYPAGTIKKGKDGKPADRSKSPCIEGWSRHCHELMTPEEIESALMYCPGAEIGVCGGYSGLIGIDIDTLDPEQQKLVLSCFPAGAPCRRGNRQKPGLLLCRWGGEGFGPSRSFRDKNGKVIVELLGRGRQFVMPPSMHPSGEPYRMADGSPLPPPVSELPVIDESHVAALETALKPYLKDREQQERGYADRVEPVSYEERPRYKAYARAALEGEAKALGAVAEGGRNNALFIAVCKLGKWAHRGLIDEQELIDALAEACGENGNNYIPDDGRSAFDATVANGLYISRDDQLPFLPSQESPEEEPCKQLSPEDEARHILRWLRRCLKGPNEVESVLVALCRETICNIKETARDWFNSISRNIKPKTEFEAAWETALGKPVSDDDLSYESFRRKAEDAEEREHTELDRCARLSPAEYQLQKHEVAARLGYRNVIELDKVVNQRKRELREEGEVPSKDNQAGLIVRLALDNLELFHTPDKAPYADMKRDGRNKTIRISSNEFAEYLQYLFFKQNNERTCSEAALKSAVQQLAALSKFKGPELEIHKRIARLEAAILIDLGTEDRKAVKITKEGWEVVGNPEARFCRTRSTRALPEPDVSGTLRDLDRYFDLHGDNRVLTIAWMTYIMRGDPPYPILQVTGPAGSAKSTLAGKLVAVTDPRKPTLRIKPKEAKDIFIGAHHSHLLAYDNLSGLSPLLSDILCSIATGGGITGRELYSDEGEHVLEEVNPVLLTGVSQVITRQDLMDRAVNILLPEIDDRRRRTPEEIANEAKELAPRVFGALLNIIVYGLKHIGNVEPLRLPRMAGFAKWGIAIEGALGCPSGTFEEAYEQNRDEALKELAEANPVAIAIGRFMKGRTDWSGTAEQLLSEVTPCHIGANNGFLNRYFPRTPNVLSRRINGELVPILRNMGIKVERGEGEKRRHFMLSRSEGGSA